MLGILRKMERIQRSDLIPPHRLLLHPPLPRPCNPLKRLPHLIALKREVVESVRQQRGLGEDLPAHTQETEMQRRVRASSAFDMIESAPEVKALAIMHPRRMGTARAPNPLMQIAPEADPQLLVPEHEPIDPDPDFGGNTEEV